jgi:hypothetical protein
MKWIPVVIGTLAVLTAACTEHFTTPGSCPTLCPGGQSEFRDTILTPIQNGDSSFSGFVDPADLVSTLSSSGGIYGEHRAVFRFVAQGDSIPVLDTNRAYTIDSVGIDIGVQDRDTTSSNFVLEIYRLPLTLDTTATFAQVDAAMTPANKLTEVPEPVTFRSGIVHVTFAADSLARVLGVPADSGVLQIGIRVRADAPTGARIGTPASGSFAPLLTTYVEAIGVSDSLKPQFSTRIAQRYFTVTPPSAPIPGDLLAVGGFPVSRSFLRFSLPPFLRDSATIIRATLLLHGDAAVVGIPGDSATLDASAVLVDFGAKSPAITGAFSSFVMYPGDSVASLEVGPLVRLWQGATGTPPILRLNLVEEGGTYIFPLFHSTRSTSGPPTLRVTYRPPFAFEGY